MPTNNENFSDSDKNQQPEYFENQALNDATKDLFKLLDEDKKIGPVNPQLAKLLRDIQTRQMYSGERNEDGRPRFKTFDHWVRHVRRLYVSKKGPGAKSDRYKHVSEALVNNRLIDAEFKTLPAQRSVLQKVCSVHAELQVDTWALVLKNSAGKKITPADVARAAIALGDTQVTMPSITASSRMPDIRAAWQEFKKVVVTEFGPSIEKHFMQLDGMLTPKKKQVANTADEPASDHNQRFILPEQSTVEALLSPARPFVTAIDGNAYIAFDGKDQLRLYMAASFPHPQTFGYSFEKDTARGVWKRNERLSGAEVAAEINRVAKLLAEAAQTVAAPGEAA